MMVRQWSHSDAHQSAQSSSLSTLLNCSSLMSLQLLVHAVLRNKHRLPVVVRQTHIPSTPVLWFEREQLVCTQCCVAEIEAFVFHKLRVSTYMCGNAVVGWRELLMQLQRHSMTLPCQLCGLHQNGNRQLICTAGSPTLGCHRRWFVMLITWSVWDKN